MKRPQIIDRSRDEHFMRQALDVERNGVSGMFSMLNRNKRSIVIDLSTEEGKSLLKEMMILLQ